MNRFGSCRALLKNSQAAICAAIEVYNRPALEYRDESTVLLLINGYELMLKAVLSKKKIPIFYPKERDKPYRSLKFWDAFNKAALHFPPWTPSKAVAKNLEILVSYRNDAVHLYNQTDFSVVINSLAQTCIEDYREIVLHVFDVDIADRMKLILHPLGFGASLDPMEFLKSNKYTNKKSGAVTKMIGLMNNAVESLERDGIDTGSFMTVFSVRLESVKKVKNADFVVPVGDDGSAEAVRVVHRPFDPNDPNWMREKELLKLVTDLHGVPLTTFVFRALVWKFAIRPNRRFCWESQEGVLTKYSRELVSFLHRLSKSEIEQALQDYKVERNTRRKRKSQRAA